MQLAPISAPIAPGTVLGSAHLRGAQPSAPVTVTAGRTLATGIRDIAVAADQLRTPGSFQTQSVGFIRRGDAWDAVQLLLSLAPSGTPKAVYSIQSTVSAMSVAPGVELDAIWDVGYAHGDSRFGTGPDAIIRRI
ncbi:MAG: hypothetical protein JWM86_2376 [Thermoleophilia bacterium]|nr:hypothetical protein [Thermoleophilia bacterium]